MGDHYVPQHYLKGFSDPEGLLWVYDRATGKCFRSQPKSVANETGMYGPELEALLANKVEAPAQGAIHRIRTLQPIDGEYRLTLAKYIAMMWKRVPEARSRVAQAMPTVIEELRSKYTEELRQAVLDHPEKADLAMRRTAELNAALDRFLRDLPPDIWQDIIAREHAASEIVDEILSMQWHFLWSPKLRFITCDNPVFFFSHEGIGQPQSELTMPFSDTVALWANRRLAPGSPAYLTAKPAAVRELNRRMAVNATRFAFARTNDAWILPLLQKERHQLNRLV